MRILGIERPWSSSHTIEIALIGLGIVIAGLIGLAGPRGRPELLGLLPVLVGALLVLSKPVLGMLLVTAGIPLQNLVVFGGEWTGLMFLGAFVAGAWLLGKLVRRDSWQPLVSTTLFKATISLLLLALASTLWAEYPFEAFSGLLQLVRLLVWGLLVMDLASSWDRIDWLAKLLTLGAVVASILTIQQFFVGGLRRAGEEIAGGPNGTAAILVTILPFAFYLIRSQGSRLWRLFGSLCVILASLAVLVTFSRSSYLLLPLAVLAHYWEAIRGRGGRGWLILMVGVAVIVAMTVIPLDLIRERAQTILPYVRSTLVGSDETSEVSPRGYAWRAGLALFQDHPILGAGYANYRFLVKRYGFVVPSYAYPYGLGPAGSPHSSYVGIMAELGVIGLALWIGVLGIALRNLAVSWSTLARTKPSTQFLLVQAVTYSFLLEIAYGWAIIIHQEKLCWLLLGLSVVIRRLADRPEWAPVPVDDHFSEQRGHLLRKTHRLRRRGVEQL